jgi:hypothetical protein
MKSLLSAEALPSGSTANNTPRISAHGAKEVCVGMPSTCLGAYGPGNRYSRAAHWAQNPDLARSISAPARF